VHPRVTTCPVALDPVFLIGRASALPRVRGFRPHLPVREGSGASCVLQLRILPPYKGGLRSAMCSTVLDPASLIGRASVMPCVLQLRILPPFRGGLRSVTRPTTSDPASLLRGLWCHHRMPYGFLWTTGLKHKEKPSRSACAARLAYSQCTRACF
jgi:hypothetical protein